MPAPKIPNELLIHRRNRGLSRKQVAALLGKSESTLRRLEQGTIRPTLDVALRLEVLYRRPVAFLYPAHYRTLREQLREAEERLTKTGENGRAAAE